MMRTARSFFTALILLFFMINGTSCAKTSDLIYPRYLQQITDDQTLAFASSGQAQSLSASQYSSLSDFETFQVVGDQLHWNLDGGWVEYTFKVTEPGFYNIAITYLPATDQNFSIERGIQVDGSYPFVESQRVVLDRQWMNRVYPFERDEFNNEVRSFQKQIFSWQTTIISDANGKYAKPYQWYFSAGSHTIRLIGIRSAVILESIALVTPEITPSYKAPAITSQLREIFFTVIEAEQPLAKSHSSVLVQSSGDPVVSPREDGVTIFNTLFWLRGGEWAQWEFNVPVDGYYQIGLRYRQNSKHNMPSFRTIAIDGVVCYDDLWLYPFAYDQNWQATYLQAHDDNEPMLFYLTAGTHQIRFTAVNEAIGPTINIILAVIADLRDLSLQISMATGNNQDRFRDWDLDKQIPDAFDRISVAANQLRQEYERLEQIGGKMPDSATSLIVSAKQLEQLLEEPEMLPLRYRQLSIDSGSISEVIGNSILTLQDEPLQIDQIFITAPQQPLPQGNAPWYSRMYVTVKNFVYSFFKNYNAVGKADEKSLDIWVGRGRDFVSLMQQLTDQEFTPQTGIKVAFSLMPREDQLILANSSGTPPDLATSVWYTTPVNLASRGALADLSEFADFEQVSNRFHPGAFRSYNFLDGMYALPETQNFWVLFYRKDIFSHLGMGLPDTWDDVVELLPVLQQMGMNFYVPVSAGTGIKAIFVMAPFFYQSGADLFSPDGLRTGLLSAEALQGFRRLTDLYTVYSLDDFVAWFFQNFRSGDIPIGVSDYNTYVQLKAAAPELEGLWGIVPMPGEQQLDGEVVRWAPGAMQATIMFEQSEMKTEAWEWMKWWTSADVQARFGNEIEAMFGVSYRWNTANLEAHSQIPWTLEELDAISEQWRWLKDIPQVPGGYILERELSFAWNKVVVGTASGALNPRLALHEADRNTRRELIRKQIEFGLIDENEQSLVEFMVPSITKPWDWEEEVLD